MKDIIDFIKEYFQPFISEKINTKRPVYCMHCANWYASTKIDQCDIRLKYVNSDSLSTAAGFQAISEYNYGKPSVLNKNNDCSKYDEIGFFGRIGRRILYDIPMKPQTDLISKLE